MGEGVFEFALPDRVGTESMPPGGLPGGIELDQFRSDLPDSRRARALERARTRHGAPGRQVGGTA